MIVAVPRVRPIALNAIVSGLLLVVITAGCSFEASQVPHSSPTTIGSSVQGTFFTGCGLHQTVFDIDGSLWAPRDLEASESAAPPGVATPQDDGTLSLVQRDLAEYTSSQGVTFALVRRPGSLVQRDC